jgi:hypothetical protein
VGSGGDRTRWAAVGRMALDLDGPMVMRSDAELNGARIALSEQGATGQARELTMAEALAVAAEAARRATQVLPALSGIWWRVLPCPKVMPLNSPMTEPTPLFPFCRRLCLWGTVGNLRVPTWMLGLALLGVSGPALHLPIATCSRAAGRRRYALRRRPGVERRSDALNRRMRASSSSSHPESAGGSPVSVSQQGGLSRRA